MNSPVTSPQDKKFEELVGLLFANFSGTFCVLSAYIDASVRDSRGQSGVLTIGCVAFGPENLKKANRAWIKLWPEPFHMTDFNARCGQYVGMDKDEIHEKMVGMVNILKRYASYRIGVSCLLSDVAQYYPALDAVRPNNQTVVDCLGTSYGLCLHSAMVKLGLNSKINGNEILYTVEAGDTDQGGAINFIQTVTKYEFYRKQYNYGGLLTVPKDKCRVLEMADFLAWEWCKFVDHHFKGAPLARKSLAELFKADALSGAEYTDWRTFGIHLFGDRLAKFYKDLADAIREIDETGKSPI